MKVKLTKDHVLGAAGETVEVDDGLANYLKSVGCAEDVKEKKEAATTKEKKEDIKHTPKKER